MGGRKRRRGHQPAVRPRSKYAESPPDFALLASLYPSFRQYVSTSPTSGRACIDFTDFAATRELTRVLLLHDHGVHWWIPDGQLCPTVPNRSNYIHWIEDLLSSGLVPPRLGSGEEVRGFDIGTGANCIYPLLGASLYGWSFVGSDIADVALEWAKKNVENNPQLCNMIEIRNASAHRHTCQANLIANEEVYQNATTSIDVAETFKLPVLVGVVKEDESFDFCMCNPPFFGSIQEAGLNPKTSCGGTSEEMVYPGGERAFINHIIEDSVSLKHQFRWFTSMIGRKANLKFLVSRIRDIGATIVKTTEFTQGYTARWGLAWSFGTVNKKIVAANVPAKSSLTFMLEGVPRKGGAYQILKSVEAFFSTASSVCRVDLPSFSVDIKLSEHETGIALSDDPVNEVDGSKIADESQTSRKFTDEICLRVSVYEQIPGTILVRGSLLNKEISGAATQLFWQLEETLKTEFCRKAPGR